jgi:hypothetical protein
MEVPVHTHASLGLGYDIRLEAEHTAGSGLLHENSVLYLSAFAVAELAHPNEDADFARFSLRRRL